MSDPVYYFFHLERTGGTTVRHVLRIHYGWNSPLVYPHYSIYEGVPELKPFVLNERTDKARYFIGHQIYYGIHEAIGKPYHYVVFLREPFTRMQSYFNYIRFSAKILGSPVLEFREWFDQYKVATQIWALTARSEMETLDDAKTILDKMSFIGLQETLQADIDQLVYPFNYVESLNTSSQRSEKAEIPPLIFTEEQEAEVRSVLDDDYKLYQYALELRSRGLNKGFKLPPIDGQLPTTLKGRGLGENN